MTSSTTNTTSSGTHRVAAKLIAATTVAALLAVGGGSLAYAADDSGSGKAPSGTAQPGGRPRGRLVRASLAIAATTIGIDAKDLANAIRNDHKTVAQVAAEHDVDPAKVVDALVKAGTEKVDAALAAKKIDAARATKIKERLPKIADQLVNHTGERGGRAKLGVKANRAKLRRRTARASLAIAATTIGIDAKDLANAIRNDHKTVAQVATEHDVDPAKVVDALVKAGTEKVDAALAAKKIDAARATKIKERLPKIADRLVNHTGERGGNAGAATSQ